MFEEIILQNFLSFKDETRFEFTASMERPKKGYEYIKWYDTVDNKKILKVQFLFGNNATGKSNFLSALLLLKDVVCAHKNSKSSKESQLPDTYFKFSSETIEKPSKIKAVFHAKKIRYIYEIEFTSSAIVQEELSKYQKSRKPINIFSRSYNEDKDVVEISFNSKLFNKPVIDIIRQNVIKNTSVISVYDEKNFESADLKNVYDFFDHVVVFYHLEKITLPSMFANRKDKEGLKKVLLPLLKDLGSNIIDYEVNTVKIKVSEDEAKIMKSIMGEETFCERYPDGERKLQTLRFAHPSQSSSGSAWLTENEESFGTLNMIRLIILLYDASRSHSPVAIDECTVGIHQQTFGRIIQFFLATSNDMQIFMASQQISIMDMEGFRRDTVKFFDKDRETGITVCNKIDLRKYHKNISILNAYFNNSFGCLPEFPSQERWIEKLEKYKELMHSEE